MKGAQRRRGERQRRSDAGNLPQDAAPAGSAPVSAPAVPGRVWRSLGRGRADPLGPNYRRLWIATAVSNLGDGVRLTALPLMAATLTRDPSRIAGIELASTLPWFLFALVSGAIVDRVDRRLAMGVVNIFRAAVMGFLALAVLGETSTLVMLYALAFLLGSAETVFDNAAQAILPSVVRKDQLERANGNLYAGELITNQFAGPPLGALLFALAAAAPFFLDAASFLIAALLILSLSGTFRAPRIEGARSTLRAEISEAVRWLWNHRLLRTLGIMLGIWNAVHTATTAILVLFALEILGLGPIGFGILSATFVIGSVIGSVAASRLSRRLGPGTTLILQVLTAAAASLVIALTSHPYVVGAMFAVEGFTSVTWNVITVSLRQSIIPDRMLGRVNSAYRLLGWGSMPLGAAFGGLLAEVLGLRAPFYVTAAVLALMGVFALRVVSNRTIAGARSAAQA